MKKILGLIIFSVAILGVILTFGKNHPAVLWTGISLISVIVLSFALWGIGKVLDALKKVLDHTLFILVALVVVGILAGNHILPSMASFILTLVLSITFVISLIRSLAKKAMTSLIWANIFKIITGYKIQYLITKQDEKEKQLKVEKLNDVETHEIMRRDIVEALRGLGYSKKDSEDSADNAIENNPKADLPDLIIDALQYAKSEGIIKQVKNDD